MNKNLDHAINMENVMAEFSKTIQLFGLTSMEARLFSYLFLSSEPKTLDEMSGALGNSKTAISMNIRSLLDMNLVTRVWKRGVRKDLYEVRTPLYKAFLGFYINKWMDATTTQKDTLEEMAKLITTVNGHEGESALMDEMAEMEEKVQSIIEFHIQMLSLLNKIKNE